METARFTNARIAARLRQRADELTRAGADEHRVAAYLRAAQNVSSHPASVAALATRGVEALDGLPGVGPRLARVIREIVGASSPRPAVQLELVPRADQSRRPRPGRIPPPPVRDILAADESARAGSPTPVRQDGWRIEAERWGSALAAAVSGDWVLVTYVLGDVAGSCVVADDPEVPGARVVLGRERESRGQRRPSRRAAG